MTMSDRGRHPDLIEDEETAAQETAQEVPQPPAQPTRRNGRARGGEPAPSSPAPTATPPDEEPAGDLRPAPEQEEPSSLATAETPEWLTQARATADPKEMLKLLAANLSTDELVKDERIAGVLGTLADRRARALIQQQEQERVEQQKRDALNRGDLYQLGELSAGELQQRVQQQQATSQIAPLMDVLTRWQSKLEPEVQTRVQGRQYGAGKTWDEGAEEYLEAVSQARAELLAEKELKRREPALRKAWLSETNGHGPTPEVDGGPAPGVREVTDEQIAAMSLEESNKYLDDLGRPLPGVNLRYTRAINLRERQR